MEGEINSFCQDADALPSSSLTPTIKLPGIIDNKLYSYVRMGKTTGDVTRIAANCLFCNGGKEIWGDNKSTGNFTKHLKKFHPTEYADHQKRKLEDKNSGDSQQPPIKKFCPVVSVSCGMKKKADNLIMSYIVNAMRPLSTVKDPAFRQMVKGLCGNSKLKVMSVDTLKMRITIAYNELVEKNTGRLQCQDYVCLTANCWSSHSRAFLGVTCHWITADFSRESIVLACTRFKGVHSYDQIADQLTTVINKYKLPLNKVVAIVTDNGTNFCKAFKEFGIEFENEREQEEKSESANEEENADSSDGHSDEEDETDEVADQNLANLFEEEKEYSLPPHCRCASHTLSLVATKDGLEVKDKRLYHSAIGKYTKLWNLTWSLKSAEIIVTICGSSLKRPVPTRWNSMYDSIKCLLSKEPHLDAICGALRVPKFQPKDIEFIKEFMQISEPIAVALDRMQGEKGNFMGSLLPTLVKTVSMLEDLKGKVKHCKDFVSAYLDGMKKRFEEIMTIDTHHPSDFVLGAISNPAFKLRWIRKDLHEGLKTKFIARAKSYASGSVTPQTLPEEVEDPFYDFEDLDTSNTSSTSNVELECAMYFNDPSQKLTMLKQYPTVEKMFRRYNTCLPSSAPVERLFSYAGLIFSARRTRLTDNMFEKLVLLKSNKVFAKE